VDKEGPPSTEQTLAAALLNICVAKGIVTRDQIRGAIDAQDTANASLATGPELVVKAWTDAGFKERLKKDCVEAAKELGLTANTTIETEMVAVFNEPGVHNVVVCTLCSCCGLIVGACVCWLDTHIDCHSDPRAVLGFPPDWFKSRTYRSRMVRNPRLLLSEAFSLDVPETTELRVHDSTADLRYIVIPARPEGTEGWSEEELKKLVTRDSMVGVAVCRAEAAKI
jgi:nitrile hydratase